MAKERNKREAGADLKEPGKDLRVRPESGSARFLLLEECIGVEAFQSASQVAPFCDAIHT